MLEGEGFGEQHPLVSKNTHSTYKKINGGLYETAAQAHIRISLLFYAE